MGRLLKNALCRRLNKPAKIADASEALGCPFCGAQPETKFWHGGGPRKTMVACRGPDCEVRPSVTGTTRGRALEAWNARR